MAVETKALKVCFHGYVQGVGFRQAIKQYATDLGIQGTVRNLPDGSVELIAIGPARVLEELVDSIREGGPGRVFRVDRRWIQPLPELKPGFEIAF